MLDLVISKLTDTHFLASILVAVGCAATILTLAMPLLTSDRLAVSPSAMLKTQHTGR